MALSVFFDRNGKPVGLWEWGELRQDEEYVQVAFFEDERIQISTVWRGINTYPGLGAPIIFETMTFAKQEVLEEWDRCCWGWRTLEEAKAAHAVLISCYMDGIDPDEPMATVKKQFDLLNLH